MAETPFGVTKVHGYVATGYESLTSNFEFVTITTSVDIRTSTVGTQASQDALDKLIQIVSLRGQPVIMGNVTGAGPYVVMLAIEHPAAWQCTATSASLPTDATLGLPFPDARANEDLVNRIKLDGVNYGFGGSTTTIVFSNVLT